MAGFTVTWRTTSAPCSDWSAPSCTHGSSPSPTPPTVAACSSSRRCRPICRPCSTRFARSRATLRRRGRSFGDGGDGHGTERNGEESCAHASAAALRVSVSPCAKACSVPSVTSRPPSLYLRLRISRRTQVSDAAKLESERVFKGKVFSVDRDRVKMPNGRTVTVEVVRHSRSVVLVPVPEPGKVILVRQYRYAVNAFLWELPAGSVDEGESPEQAARREGHEEIGLLPSPVVRLTALYPTPGYCDEGMVFFRLSGPEKTAEQAAVDEEQDIKSKDYELPARR